MGSRDAWSLHIGLYGVGRSALSFEALFQRVHWGARGILVGRLPVENHYKTSETLAISETSRTSCSVDLHDG